MSAYLIVMYDVADPDGYADYQKGAGPALMKPGVEVLVLDHDTEAYEGDRPGHQTVVLKFESKDHAKQVLESGEYQAVVGKRHAATTNSFAVLVDGFQMPS